eukprot:scaffold33712_cov57-Attheya_sp.AAC.1
MERNSMERNAVLIKTRATRNKHPLTPTPAGSAFAAWALAAIKNNVAERMSREVMSGCYYDVLSAVIGIRSGSLPVRYRNIIQLPKRRPEKY